MLLRCSSVPDSYRFQIRASVPGLGRVTIDCLETLENDAVAWCHLGVKRYEVRSALGRTDAYRRLIDILKHEGSER